VGDVFVGVMLLVVMVVGLIWWGRRAARTKSAAERSPTMPPAGPVPTRDGVSGIRPSKPGLQPTCEGCGGTSFVPRRIRGANTNLVEWSAAGRPQHVECIVCGKVYSRPNL
jgi:hypothetical protein